MKNLFTLFSLVAFVLTLQSFNVKESKLVGSWKVEHVISLNGKIKEGRKTITFSKDGTLVSVKDTGSTMTGLWKLEGETLLITAKSGQIKEEYTIQKLTKKKLKMYDGRKIYSSVRVTE